MVAANEWRDYAIDHLRDRAVFSVYRRAHDAPLFQIVKDPRLARKQGMFSVVAATGAVMKRGHELTRVLGFFDRKPQARRRVEIRLRVHTAWPANRSDFAAELPLRQGGRVGRRGRAAIERKLHEDRVEPAPVLVARAFQRTGMVEAQPFVQADRRAFG